MTPLPSLSSAPAVAAPAAPAQHRDDAGGGAFSSFVDKAAQDSQPATGRASPAEGDPSASSTQGVKLPSKPVGPAIAQANVPSSHLNSGAPVNEAPAIGIETSASAEGAASELAASLLLPKSDAQDFGAKAEAPETLVATPALADPAVVNAGPVAPPAVNALASALPAPQAPRAAGDPQQNAPIATNEAQAQTLNEATALRPSIIDPVRADAAAQAVEPPVLSNVRTVRAATFRASPSAVRDETMAALAHLQPSATRDAGRASENFDTAKDAGERMAPRKADAAMAPKPPADAQPESGGAAFDTGVNFGGFQEKLTLLGARAGGLRSPSADLAAHASDLVRTDKPAEIASAPVVKTLDLQVAAEGTDPLDVKLRLSQGRLSVVIESPDTQTTKAIEAIRHALSHEIGASEHALDALIIRSVEPSVASARATGGTAQNNDPQQGSGGAREQPQGSGRRSPSFDRDGQAPAHHHRRSHGDLVV